MNDIPKNFREFRWEKLSNLPQREFLDSTIAFAKSKGVAAFDRKHLARTLAVSDKTVECWYLSPGSVSHRKMQEHTKRLLILEIRILIKTIRDGQTAQQWKYQKKYSYSASVQISRWKAAGYEVDISRRDLAKIYRKKAPSTLLKVLDYSKPIDADNIDYQEISDE